jgi:uncharacterized metal-binding protein YceD (DUF177 family)
MFDEFSGFVAGGGRFSCSWPRQCFDTGGCGPYHARAMGNPLRDSRTAADLASVGQVIEIANKIGSFESLAGIVEADLAALDPDKVPSGWRENVVLGELQFGYADADGCVPAVSGSATAAVSAVCQRCLEPFQLQLNIEPKLLLLTTDEAAVGHAEFEVWELEAEIFRPQDIVEELLIMALPFSATHDNVADCKALSPTVTEGKMDDDSSEELLRPFAALRAQMQQNEKDPED